MAAQKDVKQVDEKKPATQWILVFMPQCNKDSNLTQILGTRASYAEIYNVLKTEFLDPEKVPHNVACESNNAPDYECPDGCFVGCCDLDIFYHKIYMFKANETIASNLGLFSSVVVAQCCMPRNYTIQGKALEKDEFPLQLAILQVASAETRGNILACLKGTIF